ncbi:MAG: HNH endonuclease signature motif containing protein [Pseudomonadota bacterium]
MGGRVKRRAAEAAVAVLQIRAAEPPVARCALCGRPLGRRVEWHHLVPKSQGGRDTVALHPICHRAVHAGASNVELARHYADVAALRARPDIARFLRWVADKPPDFHAPTRRATDARDRRPGDEARRLANRTRGER